MTPRFRKCRAALIRAPLAASKTRRDIGATSLGWQRILVPVEFSRGSKSLLDCARKLALRDAAEIIVLHVLEPLHEVRDFGYGPVVRPLPNAFATTRAKARLRSLARRHLGAVCPWSVFVRSGVVCDEILKASEAMKVGLIIMSTDGLLPPNPVKLAGMAARVHSRSSCPVLVLRNPPHRKFAKYDQ
jgi:nucleotide-binding universal stress UspA family protein